jgi:hypothetical protein
MLLDPPFQSHKLLHYSIFDHSALSSGSNSSGQRAAQTAKMLPASAAQRSSRLKAPPPILFILLLTQWAASATPSTAAAAAAPVPVNVALASSGTAPLEAGRPFNLSVSNAREIQAAWPTWQPSTQRLTTLAPGHLSSGSKQTKQATPSCADAPALHYMIRDPRQRAAQLMYPCMCTEPTSKVQVRHTPRGVYLNGWPAAAPNQPPYEQP